MQSTVEGGIGRAYQHGRPWAPVLGRQWASAGTDAAADRKGLGRLIRSATVGCRLPVVIGQTPRMHDAEAFFAIDGDDTFVPRRHARSPWAADMLHGRLLAALAARHLERDHERGSLRVARLTVDMFRVVPLAPVVVTAKVGRDGRRIRVVDLTVECEGQAVLRVSALLLAGGAPPPGTVWGRSAWSMPEPVEIAARPPRAPEGDPAGSPDLRVVGGFDAPGPRRAWIREPWPLVDGEKLSPLVRAVLAADVGSPLSSWSDAGLQYINADLSISLVRRPKGEWIGLEVIDHLDHDGIALGICRLYDAGGPIGHCQMTGVARPFESGG